MFWLAALALMCILLHKLVRKSHWLSPEILHGMVWLGATTTFLFFFQQVKSTK